MARTRMLEDRERPGKRKWKDGVNPFAPKRQQRKKAFVEFVEAASAIAGDYAMTEPDYELQTIPAAAPPVPPNTYSITLEPDLVETLTALSASRGVDMQTLIRVGLRNLAQRQNFYSLTTVIGFGKYRGEKMETVIRCDPGYVDWMTKNNTSAEFSESALDLLREIQTAGREA